MGGLAITLFGGYNLIVSTDLSKWTFALNISLTCLPSLIGIIAVLISYCLRKSSINKVTGEVITRYGRIIVQLDDGIDLFSKDNLFGYYFSSDSKSLSLIMSKTGLPMLDIENKNPSDPSYTLEKACQRGIVKIHLRKVKIPRSDDNVEELLQIIETDKQGTELCLAQNCKDGWNLYAIKPFTLKNAKEKVDSLFTINNEINFQNIFYCPWRGIICACVIKNESPTWMIFWSDLDKWIEANKSFTHQGLTAYSCRSLHFHTKKNSTELQLESFQLPLKPIPFHEKYPIQRRIYGAIPIISSDLALLIANYVI